MNDDETPLSGLAPPVKKKTTVWQVAAVQVVRKFLESHGYDASNVDADDVSNDIGSTSVWEYEIEEQGKSSYEEFCCSIEPIDSA